MKIAFYKSKKHLFNRLVAWWTRGPYSHCEVVLAEGIAMSLCGSSSFMDGGVRTKHIPLHSDIWDIVDVPADANFAAHWFDQHAGEHYDVLGLFGFIVNRGVQDQRAWFCSEAVAAALQMQEPWRYDANTLHALLTDPSYPATLAK